MGVRHDRFMAVIDSSDRRARRLIRKSAGLATRCNAKFLVLYVQTSRESPDRIPLANQRYLINNFKLASELGGTVIQKKSDDERGAIIEACAENKVSCMLAAKPEIGFFSLFVFGVRVKSFIEKLAKFNINLSILS